MKNKCRHLWALAFALLLFVLASCDNEVKKVELNNQFAISLFSDTIVLGDLLNSLDSTTMQFIRIKEDGKICAFYADSLNEVVVSEDVLGQLDDVTFSTSNEFEIPTIPASPVPVPIEVPLDDMFSIPFEYEGYSINQVVLKSGTINLSLSTNLDFVDEISLSTEQIKMNDGSDFNITLEGGQDNEIVIDLTNCEVAPLNNHIVFSALLSLTVSDQEIGGMYFADINGGITNLQFKSIDGAIEDIFFDFYGSHDFEISFDNIYGDLSVLTPDFSIKYTNSFGLEAKGIVDSLYLTDANGVKTELIKDWNELEIQLNSTGGYYDSITTLDDQIVDEINLLSDYRQINFKGNIILGCENATPNTISDDSHIDIVADLELPLNINVENLYFIDTVDFNLNLNNSEDNEDGQVQIESLFEEIEFKFVFGNKLPLQLKPQIYMMENNQVVDSLMPANACVNACFDNVVTEDVIIVKVTDDKLHKIQNADQLIIAINLSTLANDVEINANDYFSLRLGLKTKTEEIYLDDIN